MELTVKCTKKLSSAYSIAGKYEAPENDDSNMIGGIFGRGDIVWRASGSRIETFSMKTGHPISHWSFSNVLGMRNGFVVCAEQIPIPGSALNILAIAVEFRDPINNVIVIFSVDTAQVLQYIQVNNNITCCKYIDKKILKKTPMNMYRGCLAIGTQSGKIILFDLDVDNWLAATKSYYRRNKLALDPCTIVPFNASLEDIEDAYSEAIENNFNFGMQLEDMKSPNIVLSLLAINSSSILVVGLEDGRLIFYDLQNLQIFQSMNAPKVNLPLVFLSYLEPIDDPRPCFYIWAMYENSQKPLALLYSVTYRSRSEDNSGATIYKNFQSCNVCLQVPLNNPGSRPISCQSILKSFGQDSVSICLLGWRTQNSILVVIFDLNQWYKEQMPYNADVDKNLNYLTLFLFNTRADILDITLDEKSLRIFESIQRPHEHFFPNSLTFNCICLQERNLIFLEWYGLQNQVLRLLDTEGPTALLDPAPYYQELFNASLVPQLMDNVISANPSIDFQREMILSIALEYKLYGLLKKCVHRWADGSHTGVNPMEGLSLSTLTDWIWKRAKCIKDHCNILSVPLFDYTRGCVDRAHKKELLRFFWQLDFLAKLINEIRTKYKDCIPSEVKETITTQYSSIQMAADYQGFINWLLELGLLPEIKEEHGRSVSRPYYNLNDSGTTTTGFAYPYKALRDFYTSKRIKLRNLDTENDRSLSSGCDILFVDAFIEREFSSGFLQQQWVECGGTSLYPPSSVQALTRILLVPQVPLKAKYELLLYLFLDLSLVSSESYRDVMEKLMYAPAPFRLDYSSCDIIKAFWNLDHEHFEDTFRFVSALLQGENLRDWQSELLVKSLLLHNKPKLALQAINLPGVVVPARLKMRTFVINDSLSQAFRCVKLQRNAKLLREYFEMCINLNKYDFLQNTTLTESEEHVLQDLLKELRSIKANNVYLIYLLKRSKYVGALNFFEKFNDFIQQKRTLKMYALEISNDILLAYERTISPFQKRLLETYVRNRSDITQRRSDEKRECLGTKLHRVEGENYLKEIMRACTTDAYVDQETGAVEGEFENVPFLLKPFVLSDTNIMQTVEAESEIEENSVLGNEKRNTVSNATVSKSNLLVTPIVGNVMANWTAATLETSRVPTPTSLKTTNISRIEARPPLRNKLTFDEQIPHVHESTRIERKSYAIRDTYSRFPTVQDIPDDASIQTISSASTKQEQAEMQQDETVSMDQSEDLDFASELIDIESGSDESSDIQLVITPSPQKSIKVRSAAADIDEESGNKYPLATPRRALERNYKSTSKYQAISSLPQLSDEIIVVDESRSGSSAKYEMLKRQELQLGTRRTFPALDENVSVEFVDSYVHPIDTLLTGVESRKAKESNDIEYSPSKSETNQQRYPLATPRRSLRSHSGERSLESSYEDTSPLGRHLTGRIVREERIEKNYSPSKVSSVERKNETTIRKYTSITDTRSLRSQSIERHALAAASTAKDPFLLLDESNANEDLDISNVSSIYADQSMQSSRIRSARYSALATPRRSLRGKSTESNAEPRIVLKPNIDDTTINATRSSDKLEEAVVNLVRIDVDEESKADVSNTSAIQKHKTKQFLDTPRRSTRAKSVDPYLNTSRMDTSVLDTTLNESVTQNTSKRKSIQRRTSTTLRDDVKMVDEKKADAESKPETLTLRVQTSRRSLRAKSVDPTTLGANQIETSSVAESTLNTSVAKDTSKKKIIQRRTSTDNTQRSNRQKRTLSVDLPSSPALQVHSPSVVDSPTTTLNSPLTRARKRHLSMSTEPFADEHDNNDQAELPLRKKRASSVDSVRISKSQKLSQSTGNLALGSDRILTRNQAALLKIAESTEELDGAEAEDGEHDASFNSISSRMSTRSSRRIAMRRISTVQEAEIEESSNDDQSVKKEPKASINLSKDIEATTTKNDENNKKPSEGKTK